ncbi:hypothetical protein CQA53_08730 [Helicobacter didelphidarum]|uniref:Uncharacterized protein n=1 Tax=Helicobacter didelphidarum TaxID=2040648 RepID=A0A3D8IDN7_9HELI|nr:hypothetical protein [Helicobacter didelphidarum]RDU63218.1 hypothetical protein CQA53_08730 [Helicobacter didelphidarum]
MKRLFSIFVLALTPGISSLSAKAHIEVAQVQTSHHQFQQSDADFLFNGIDTSKVAVLDNQEMEETKGEFWWFVIPLAIALINYAFSCGVDKQCGKSAIEIPTIDIPPVKL